GNEGGAAQRAVGSIGKSGPCQPSDIRGLPRFLSIPIPDSGLVLVLDSGQRLPGQRVGTATSLRSSAILPVARTTHARGCRGHPTGTLRPRSGAALRSPRLRAIGRAT